MSRLYSRIVRSEENLPIRAVAAMLGDSATNTGDTYGANSIH